MLDRLHPASSAIRPSLPDVAPWNRLKPGSIERLLSVSATLSVSRGDEVIAELGIIMFGALAIEHHLSDGRRILSELLHPGSLVDLRRSGRARQGRLTALKASTMLVIDACWYDDHIGDTPDIAAAMAIQQRDQLSRQRDHATDLAVKTPFEKLASVLFELQRWPDASVGEPGTAKTGLRIPIRRTDIADYIGIKPETLSRAVRCLEREHLIRLPKPDRILFTDAPAVRRIANGGRPRRSTKRD